MCGTACTFDSTRPTLLTIDGHDARCTHTATVSLQGGQRKVAARGCDGIRSVSFASIGARKIRCGSSTMSYWRGLRTAH